MKRERRTHKSSSPSFFLRLKSIPPSHLQTHRFHHRYPSSSTGKEERSKLLTALSHYDFFCLVLFPLLIPPNLSSHLLFHMHITHKNLIPMLSPVTSCLTLFASVPSHSLFTLKQQQVKGHHRYSSLSLVKNEERTNKLLFRCDWNFDVRDVFGLQSLIFIDVVVTSFLKKRRDRQGKQNENHWFSWLLRLSIKHCHLLLR